VGQDSQYVLTLLRAWKSPRESK